MNDKDTLAPADAMFFKGEQDLRTRGTGNLLYTLDTIPDWDRFVTMWDRVSRTLPPMYKRVEKASVPGRLPEWRDTEELDLSYHVRRAAVPRPGTMREVLDYAAVDGMTMHDPARPLWQVTLLEGLDGDGAAVLMKFHHSWLDGNAMIQLGMQIYDFERDADLGKPMPQSPLGQPGQGRSFGDLAQGPLTNARRAWAVTSGVGKAAKRVATNPRKVVAEGSELVASTRRVLKPIGAKPSPLLTGRSGSSRFDAVDIPFADLRAATKPLGFTINDGYLAGVAGGIRRYHEHLGAPIELLPIGMPVSTRGESDSTLGNAASARMLAAPIGIVDPVERMQAFHELVLSVRHEPAIDLMANGVSLMVHLPDQVMTGPLAQLIKVDVGVSQVVGMRQPAYLAGAQLTRAYGFGPKTHLAAFMGMMTHLDTCCIGVHSDPAAVTDPDLLVRCLYEGFEEVLAVGRAAQREL